MSRRSDAPHVYFMTVVCCVGVTYVLVPHAQKIAKTMCVRTLASRACCVILLVEW
eukprot:m.1656985 g.1656985  ORF g.1656985 m.1656985 type:complete len:55 (-) comp110066_c0_seq1:23-187(-)